LSGSGVLDSLLEDLVGELAVGEGAGQLQCPHHHGEEPDGLAGSGRRLRRRQTGDDLFHDGRRALGVRLRGDVRAAADLVEQCGGGASDAGLVTVLGRQVVANEVLESLSAGPQRVVPRHLRAQFVGDNVGDEVVLGGEVCVERPVGEPGVRHQRRDARAVYPVLLESVAGLLDDPLARHLLVLLGVARDRLSPVEM
jgi:hypothetical protein